MPLLIPGQGNDGWYVVAVFTVRIVSMCDEGQSVDRHVPPAPVQEVPSEHIPDTETVVVNELRSEASAAAAF